MSPNIVIVGGSDAGISAALRIKELEPSAHVTVALADAYPNYSICGIPFFVSGETPRVAMLAHRTGSEIEAAGITLRPHHRATRIDPSARVVTFETAEKETSLAYDALIIGTGASPREPSIEGIHQEGVHFLHTIDDALALKQRIDVGAKRVMIVGGGYIGVEMADALRHRGLDVVLLESGPSVLRTMDTEFGALVGEELRAHGVQIHFNAAAKRIERRGDPLIVYDNHQTEHAVDVVIVVVGVQPNTKLGQSAGITLGARGAMVVDRRMRTNVEGIFAAGDCVHTHHRLLKEPVYMPLGTTSHKQGRIAGENAVGRSREFEGVLGTQVVKVMGLVIGRTGLRDHEAVAAGFAPLTVESRANSHKAYYPGATELFVRITADKLTHRLLGAQVIGRYGAEVSKRIDVPATAIFHAMSISDIANLDLTYTPPLSSPWDPVQMACFSWEQAARGGLV